VTAAPVFPGAPASSPHPPRTSPPTVHTAAVDDLDVPPF